MTSLHLPVPLWVVALVLAMVAPLSAKMLASYFEARGRERSRRLLDVIAKDD